MSVFTDNEIEYMKGQKLGRLATVREDGAPQIAPVGFRYNADLDAIEIGGRNMSRTKKYHNVKENPHVAFVIDDVLPPWQPRGVEIRGIAETVSTGGKGMYGPKYEIDDAIIRIKPTQVIGWGLGDVVEGDAWNNNRKVGP
jgi:pyridoxamine 5'-phosphate oxidase family protein